MRGREEGQKEQEDKRYKSRLLRLKFRNCACKSIRRKKLKKRERAMKRTNKEKGNNESRDRKKAKTNQ